MKSEMTSRERFINAIQGKPVDKVPFCDYVDHGMEMRLRKYYGFNETDYAFWKKFGVDAVEFCEYYAPLFVGDPKTRTLTAQGKLHDFGSGEAFVEEGLIREEEDLELMEFPDLGAPGFYDFAKDYIEQCKKYEMASCFALRSFPAHTVLYSMGLEYFSYALADDVELIEEIIRRYNKWNIKLIEDLQNLGMDSIIVCNDMASNDGPLMSPTTYRELFHKPSLEVASHIKVPWAFHSDGNLEVLYNDLLEMTPCLNPVDPNCMDIYALREKFGRSFVPWGNVDVTLLSTGTTEEVEKCVIKLLTEIGGTGGYIFGSGNSIPTYCKLENVIAMVETYKKFVGKE
ncbi:hypothetical protein AN644_01640 [Candidatus Epulonipiscium fishelsonii]|nr:hypothetical protein AN644_01640 [Epulopiscium sp. SCG-C06WGA-EpuloA1]